jgi:hypothetical protein
VLVILATREKKIGGLKSGWSRDKHKDLLEKQLKQKGLGAWLKSWSTYLASIRNIRP